MSQASLVLMDQLTSPKRIQAMCQYLIKKGYNKKDKMRRRVVLLYYQNNHFTCSNRGLSSEV
jgi:hypothetical protein